MEEQIEIQAKKRPLFLTIICIISFVGVGYTVLKSLWEINRIFTGFMDSSILFSMYGFMLLSNIVFALLCLIGVLLMWKLKKAGYIIYLIGEVIPLILPLILMHNSFYGLQNLILGFLISSAFIVMYSLNFKHLS
jgi:hypothetical protein